jgi:hypothetical protein
VVAVVTVTPVPVPPVVLLTVALVVDRQTSVADVGVRDVDNSATSVVVRQPRAVIVNDIPVIEEGRVVGYPNAAVPVNADAGWELDRAAGHRQHQKGDDKAFGARVPP